MEKQKRMFFHDLTSIIIFFFIEREEQRKERKAEEAFEGEVKEELARGEKQGRKWDRDGREDHLF